MGQASKQRRQKGAALERAPGCYWVSGVTTVAGEGKQPAYFDGQYWWLLGWECWVETVVVHEPLDGGENG